MRIKRKVVSQLLLTPAEVESLFDLIEKAKAGQTVHYAETETGPNQYFGIGIDVKYAFPDEPRFRNDKPVPVKAKY